MFLSFPYASHIPTSPTFDTLRHQPRHLATPYDACYFWWAIKRAMEILFYSPWDLGNLFEVWV